VEENTVNAFELYLDKYPEGDYVKIAKKEIAELEKKEAIDKERKLLDIAIGAGTIISLESFIEKYPAGEFTNEAQKLLEKLVVETEKKEWKAARKTHVIDAYQEYLEEYPDGKYSYEAEEAIEVLEMETAWALAQKKNLPKYYRSFLEEYPSNPFSEEAEELIQELYTDLGALQYFDPIFSKKVTGGDFDAERAPSIIYFSSEGKDYEYNYSKKETAIKVKGGVNDAFYFDLLTKNSEPDLLTNSHSTCELKLQVKAEKESVIAIILADPINQALHLVPNNFHLNYQRNGVDEKREFTGAVGNDFEKVFHEVIFRKINQFYFVYIDGVLAFSFEGKSEGIFSKIKLAPSEHGKKNQEFFIKELTYSVFEEN